MHTVGTVSRTWLGWSGGQRTWRHTVEFRADAGTVWTVEPALSRGREQLIGTPAPLAYHPDAPDRIARRTEGLDAHVHLALVGAGLATATVAPPASVLGRIAG